MVDSWSLDIAWKAGVDQTQWLGDPDFWKPDEDVDVVRLFRNQGEKCGCGHKARSWRLVREYQEVEYNCPNSQCPYDAHSSANDFYGVFFLEFDDANDDDSDGDIYAFIQG